MSRKVVPEEVTSIVKFNREELAVQFPNIEGDLYNGVDLVYYGKPTLIRIIKLLRQNTIVTILDEDKVSALWEKSIFYKLYKFFNQSL